MKVSPLTKTLKFGFPSKDGAEPTREVVFGKIQTVGDTIRISDSEQSSIEMQRRLMNAAASIIAFGDKKRAPFLSELLTLKRADRDIILEGYLEFFAQSYKGLSSEKINADTHKLFFGLEEGGHIYDVVTLCDKSSELDGYEEQELLRTVRKQSEQDFLLIGQDIVSFSQSDGEEVLEGPISLEVLKRLNSVDGNVLMEAVDERRLLFRSPRQETPKDAGTGD